MTSRSFVLIANPHAGRGKAAKVLSDATAALRRAGAPTQGQTTTSIEHATELAADAAEAGDVAVAIGGDGLLRAVAAGASRYGGTVGIVPCGRGNDYARTVGITDLNRCVSILLDAVPRPTDCIAVARGLTASRSPQHAIAIGNVYVGFDSLSNALANDLKVNLGEFTYTYSTARVAMTMQPLQFRLTIDGRATEYRGSGITITNSKYYGGGVPVAPGADVHDGLLDVLLFQQFTRRSRIAMLLAMRKGTHERRPDVQHVRASTVGINLDPPLEAYSDGDSIGRTPLTAWILPGAISSFDRE